MKLKVMSFNIFCGILTEERISKVIRTIRTYSPDIVGMQEGMDASVLAIEKELGEDYGILGHGRNPDKKGENCNILYKKSVFDLAETGTVWLTDTPEEYSYFEGSACPRIMTYQILQAKNGGETILHINTHLDHILEEVRARQAVMLTEYIKEKFGDKYPTVITGDFNCEKTELAFDIITSAGFKTASAYGEDVPTYQGFGNGPSMTIDYIFANGHFSVDSYKVCDEKIDGEYASDHSAIVSELTL